MVSSKKKGLHFDFISDFPIFVPKSGCSLKKKGSSLGIVLRINICSGFKTVCAIFEGGPEATASFASPNIHHWTEILFKKTLVCGKGLFIWEA